MYTSSLISTHVAHVPNHVLLFLLCVYKLRKVLKRLVKKLAPSHVQGKIYVQNVRLVSTDRVNLQQCHYHQNHAKGADAQFGNARALAVKEQARHQAVAQEPRLNRDVNKICARIPVVLSRPSLEKQNSPLIRRSSFYEQGTERQLLRTIQSNQIANLNVKKNP